MGQVPRIRPSKVLPMTKEQQRAAIRKKLKEYTADATSSRKKAAKALIGEGFYTKKGKLKKRYGGGSNAAAA